MGRWWGVCDERDVRFWYHCCAFCGCRLWYRRMALWGMCLGFVCVLRMDMHECGFMCEVCGPGPMVPLPC